MCLGQFRRLIPFAADKNARSRSSRSREKASAISFSAHLLLSHPIPLHGSALLAPAARSVFALSSQSNSVVRETLLAANQKRERGEPAGRESIHSSSCRSSWLQNCIFSVGLLSPIGVEDEKSCCLPEIEGYANAKEEGRRIQLSFSFCSLPYEKLSKSVERSDASERAKARTRGRRVSFVV